MVKTVPFDQASCNLQLLLVDDNRDSIEITQQYLNDLDPSLIIHTSSSGIEALEKLVKTEYDVIVSDYKMPELNGLEFLAELRNTKNFTPFVIFTGSEDDGIALQAQNLGARYCQLKTGDPAIVYRNLLTAVRKAGCLLGEKEG